MAPPPTAWVIGATSILGYNILKTAPHRLNLVPWCSRHQRASQTIGWRRINLDDPSDWEPLRHERPDLLLYCGGVCNVARCEAHPTFARAINIGGVGAMLDVLPSETRLVYCSSDHVFGGDRGPYTESTAPHPISVYGRTRVEAEHMVLQARPDALVVRIGLPIGPSMSGRIGHLDWLRYRHRNGLRMSVIDGEARAAVLADAAAQRILALAHSNTRGIRHLVATQLSPRPRLATRLCADLGLTPRFDVIAHHELDYPHLGIVDLQTEYRDRLAAPLPSPFDGFDTVDTTKSAV